MNEEDYLEQRVADQIAWYDKQSSLYKKWFMRLKVAEIILALLIPFLTGYITTENVGLKVTVGLIGVIIAATTGIITLYKLQENWIQYRTIAESLKHEKFLFITKAGPYKVNESFPLFVERVESFISKENTQWATFIKQKDNTKADSYSYKEA